MENPAAEITRTLDEYQHDWESPDTRFEAEDVRRELLNGIEVVRLTHRLVDTPEFRRLIYYKLAQRDTVSPFDRWWRTPTHPLMESLLTRINLSLSEACRPPVWRRRVSAAWAILRELLFLGIVVGLLLAGQTNFERRIVSILILIYTYLGLEAGRLSFHLTGFEFAMGDVVGRMAPTIRSSGTIWRRGPPLRRGCSGHPPSRRCRST